MDAAGTKNTHVDTINNITEKIICAAYTVANKLGFGFLEKVYENAMAVELRAKTLNVLQQKPLTVFYKSQIVGEYFADLFIENEIVVELKVAKRIDETHQAQLLNYLKASNYKIGLLINFGNTKVEIKRMVNGL